MPWGLFFFPVCAFLLCFRQKPCQGLSISARSALLLMAAAFLLLFIDLPLGDTALNMGTLFLWVCALWLLLREKGLHRLRCLLLSLFLAALIFVLKFGILWQLEPLFGSWEPLLIPVGCLLLGCSGGYGEALLGGALASTTAATTGLLFLGSEMGLFYYALWGWLSGSAWLLRWIILHLRRLCG